MKVAIYDCPPCGLREPAEKIAEALVRRRIEQPARPRLEVLQPRTEST